MPGFGRNTPLTTRLADAVSEAQSHTEPDLWQRAGDPEWDQHLTHQQWQTYMVATVEGLRDATVILAAEVERLQSEVNALKNGS